MDDKQYLWKIEECYEGLYQISVFDTDYITKVDVFTEDIKLIKLFKEILVDDTTAVLNIKHEQLGGVAEIKIKSSKEIINYFQYYK